MSLRKCIARTTWLVGAVSDDNDCFSLSLGYCCMGQGIFMVVPAGKWARLYVSLFGLPGLLFPLLFPFIVDKIYEVDGKCVFAESCLRFSCPFNKATYESIIKSYSYLGISKVRDVKRLVEEVEILFEELVKTDPELKNKLCQSYYLFYEQAPIRIRKR